MYILIHHILSGRFTLKLNKLKNDKAVIYLTTLMIRYPLFIGKHIIKLYNSTIVQGNIFYKFVIGFQLISDISHLENRYFISLFIFIDFMHTNK